MNSIVKTTMTTTTTHEIVRILRMKSTTMKTHQFYLKLYGEFTCKFNNYSVIFCSSFLNSLYTVEHFENYLFSRCQSLVSMVSVITMTKNSHDKLNHRIIYHVLCGNFVVCAVSVTKKQIELNHLYAQNTIA